MLCVYKCCQVASHLHRRNFSTIYRLLYFKNPFPDKQNAIKCESEKYKSVFHHAPHMQIHCFSGVNSINKCSKPEDTAIHNVDYLDANDKVIYDILAKDMLVQKDFLTEEEEQSLLNEAERYLSRLRYQNGHWDNAIHEYRETEKTSWNENNTKVIHRVQKLAFGAGVVPLPHVHVLDISKDGYIRPHVDAVRFCGDTIAGMCLLSSCVMRLALEKDSSKYGDVFLPRRCLYIMKHRARYEFTHEVLKAEDSVFRNQIVPRDRRISIICRCEPDPANSQ
ncbi:unnamed protein product [Candidula unifasciata]|uniref:Uncharacterized protein n=1 Tax=Candidula unifasciata TaxID=100452 RepID=A0A8S3Z5N9_9EUPU|nr:unnamed protein product [Candidula unifasciata]